MNKGKIQKLLANAGVASRRQVEAWIKEGRIVVNGQKAHIGQIISETDKVIIAGKVIRLVTKQTTRVLIYHKPVGEVTTRNDPQGRPTVFQHLPVIKSARWIAIGRLDINTSGLLLFTNNGQLANQLMHPKSQIEREYAVRVNGTVGKTMLQTLKKGVQLEDGLAKFNDIQYQGGSGSNAWYHVILCEGRNREVRRLWESQVGIRVSRLMRVRFGNIKLPRGLQPGQYQELEDYERYIKY